MTSHTSTKLSRKNAAFSPREIIACVVLIFGAFVLYSFRLSEPPRYVFDETYHAYTASELVRGNVSAYWPGGEGQRGVSRGQTVYTTWTHPPLSRLWMQAGIRVFGDNPFGWRIASALIGALGIGVVFCFGRILFDSRAGLFAGVLLLLDGLWFVQSRTAMLDIFLAFFLLGAYFVFFLYLERDDRSRFKFLLFAGVALGLALATKWSAVYSLFFLTLWATYREFRFAKRVRVFPIVAGVFAAIPAAIYLLAYLQFFAMNYSLSDWWELQTMMWRYHSGLEATHDWTSPWWSWPLMLRPVWYHAATSGTRVAHIFAMGNPAIWWLFLPAIFGIAWQWKNEKFNAAHGLILLGFLGNWLPWALSPRIAFVYHMLPSVPFGCIAIALALRQLELQKHHWIVWTYLGVVLMMFQFFYPHLSALPISWEYSNQHYWLPGWKPE